MKRRTLSRHSSKRNFRRGTGVHKKNSSSRYSRGGRRL